MDSSTFTAEASQAIANSSDLATQDAHTQVLPIHLAMSLLHPSQADSKQPQGPAPAAPILE